MKMIVAKCLMGLSLFFIMGEAYALNCEVTYRAKKDNKESNWFGSVNKPEFSSGTAYGSGNTRQACERDALADLRSDGWKITYKRLRVIP